jgi:hypothetical protein
LDGLGGDLGSRGEPKLGQDVFYVGFRGPLGDHQPGGDLLVGTAFGDEVGDLLFAAGEGRLGDGG